MLVEVIEYFGIEAHGIGESGAAFDGGPHAIERLLEVGVLLVGSENFKTLHQRQAGIDHDGELPEEHRDVLGLDLGASESWHREFFALLADGPGRNAFAPECRGQGLFVGSYALSLHFFAIIGLSRKCENRHGSSPR